MSVNYDITAEIVSAFVAASINAIAFYGDEIEVEETDNISTPVAYMSVDQNLDESISFSTSGYYGAGTIYMFIVARTTSEALNLMTSIIELGYLNSEGRLGHKSVTPFQIGGVDVLHFKPLDLNFKTQKFGKNRMIENAIEIIIKRSL